MSIAIITAIILAVVAPGILLSLIAPFLFALMSLPNLIVVLVNNYKTHSFLKTVDMYSLQSALNVDKFGNKNLSPLLNTLLIKKNGYKFGDPEETISSVLGRNQFVKTLTIIGWVIVILLFIIDYKFWFKGGHCLNSIK
jgi:hypothetical protein